MHTYLKSKRQKGAKMAEKVPYKEIIDRVKGDVDYIAEEAYEDGRNQAAEAYQKRYTDGKNSTDLGREKCRYEYKSEHDEPCRNCKRSKYDKYTPIQAEEIEIGVDEVVSLDYFGKDVGGSLPWVVTVEDRDVYCGIDADGKFHRNQKEYVRKTGRKFDIKSVLNQMREGAE